MFNSMISKFCKKEFGIKLNGSVFILIAISLVLLIALLINHATISSRTFVSVDMHEAMAIPARILAGSTLNKQTQAKVLKQYSRLFVPTVKEYAQRNHLTVISTKVIADGANKDITDKVVQLTLKKVAE